MLKSRLHFFEIEDLEWCPRVVRDGITDILQFSINFGRYYQPIVPLLAEAIQNSGLYHITDLCSGGGGPWPTLFSELSKDKNVKVRLTDIYPNRKAFMRMRELLGNDLQYELQPVSAFDVSSEGEKQLRTIFTGFHHFQPNQALQILSDAVEKGDGIAVFEFTQRSAVGVLLPLLAPLGTVLVAPFAQPFRLSRLLLTYVLPVLPICTLFDGVVSCLRTYSIDELHGLVNRLPSNNYIWQIGEAPGKVNPVTYLIGYPSNDD